MPTIPRDVTLRPEVASPVLVEQTVRKALVVGINYYQYGPALHGCVDDAHAVKSALETNGDGSANFETKLLTGTGPTDPVTRASLKDAISALFSTDDDIALFYFAGHGHIETTGGYLLSSDARRGDEGVSLAEIVTLANLSPAKNRVIILDSCHSGIAAARPTSAQMSELKEGSTILTASTAEQYATEDSEGGTFTKLLVDALGGAGANLVGEITPGSTYAHIDQSLGAWNQRPVFKTNIKRFVWLRKVQPAIELGDLRRIAELFPRRGHVFALDPSFEPELVGRPPGAPAPDPTNTRTFAVLQRYSRVNLVVPEGAPHMWHAAMASKACRLTALGEHYRRLAELKRL
jgi:hypothetical protein